jgi:hypothetical protein
MGTFYPTIELRPPSWTTVFPLAGAFTEWLQFWITIEDRVDWLVEQALKDNDQWLPVIRAEIKEAMEQLVMYNNLDQGVLCIRVAPYEGEQLLTMSHFQ